MGSTATSTVTSVQTVTKPGSSTTVTSTVTPSAVTSTVTVTSASTLTLPAVTSTITALPVVSTTTTTVTSTTTTTDQSPTISGYNTPDSAGCLDGQEYVSGSDTYVQTCNVEFDGDDIAIGNAGFGPTNLDQCADLCEQTSGCVAAVFRTFPLGDYPTGCFLKSGYVQTHAAQGYDTVFKLATPAS